ncbi:MAG TPA: DUF4142 domain-containing protein [Stenotrophomonas sp.]|nr:DUF4142 domain-containing protein [Stenotrophomonas sp.]
MHCARLSLPALLLCLLAATPDARAAQAQAKVDPNDPAAAQDRYVAPKVRPASREVPGLLRAQPEERAGLGLLSVIDQYQADLSRVALDRGLDPEVQAWAESALRDHAARKGRRDPWLPDIGHPRAQAWIRRGQQELAALRAADARAVSSAYLQAMTQSLAETQQLLEDELIPQATTADVRAYLSSLRGPLAVELSTARRLQMAGESKAGDAP